MRGLVARTAFTFAARWQQLIAILLTVTCLAVSSPVLADDQSTCNDKDADREKAIAACTRAISSGRFSGDQLKTLFFSRARNWSAKREAANAWYDYAEALRSDPKNPDLLSRTFLSAMNAGAVDEAGALADRLLQLDKSDRIARLAIGVRALKQKQYDLARQNFAQSVRGPVTDLTAALLTAWALSGTGDTRGAIDALDRLAGPDWYAIFKDLHAGLILDVANKKDAGKRYERAYKADSVALRTVESYGRYLSRTVGKDDALKIYREFDKAVPNHPVIAEEMKEIAADRKLPALVGSPQSGAAEALYGLGASIGRRGGEDLAVVYLQLALYLEPTHAMALLSLADLYESLKKPDLAIKVYDRIAPSSPLRRNADIQIASDLDALDRTDESKNRLERLIADHPKDNDAIVALGNILRGRKAFSGCGDIYSKAIANLVVPEKANWVLFYFRGICYERSKQWPKAEADLKKALDLFPDQPLVLNYLGYSWIDQGVNLDEGMKMIRRAVEQRPDDGYIVDSLGWANYRIGKYEEAVKQLERAVELQRDDPTIKVHLGDAYWRRGDKGRAMTQWSEARKRNNDDLNEDDRSEIEQRLRDGLPDTPTATTPPSLEVAVKADAPAPLAIDHERGPRVALVIGNSNYLGFPKIPNPRNDAEDLAAELKNLGFDVLLGIDLKRADMEDIFIRFAKKAREADAALVFYAGHGLQHQGINYLAPVDAKIDDEADLRRLFNLQDVIADLQGAGHVRILIVDACRDNEVVQQLAKRLPATRSTAFTRGLAAVSGADGTLIAFATQPNKVAQDGQGRNSPFTASLLKNLPTPGLELRTLMTRVRAEVVTTTQGEQRPEVWDSLVGEFTFQASK